MTNKNMRSRKGKGGGETIQTWHALSDSEKQAIARELLGDYGLTEEEREVFVQSPRRVNKILGIEKYKDARIVAEVVASEACIAGHAVGDKIQFDSVGRLVLNRTDERLCIRLLNRVWYRLIMILDRMADDTGDSVANGAFTGEVIEVRMSCYGAPFPYGDCGHVLMEFSVKGPS